MGIRIVTPPTVQPIDILGLAALKQHLNEAPDVSDVDDLISTYCQVAWDYCERYTWRQLLTASLRLSRPCWRRTFVLPRPSVSEVVSVQYFDAQNELQTLDAADWRADLEEEVAELEIRNFPQLCDRIDAVRVNYVAGYGDETDDFPPVLLHAVRLLVGQYYETREPSDADTSTVDALLEAVWVRDERLTEFE